MSTSISKHDVEHITDNVAQTLIWYNVSTAYARFYTKRKLNNSAESISPNINNRSHYSISEIKLER